MSEQLTVLMPARNAAETISLAIRSVMRGLSDDSTILVLDDASEDATTDVIRSLARSDRRVRLISADSPMGVARGLNVLLEEADTALVARMDADDVALPWRFAAQLRGLRVHDADVVFANAIKFGPTALALRPQPPVGVSPAASPFELLLTNTLLHPTLVGKRDVLVAAGGYRAVPAEDWDLWMRLVMNGSRLARIANFVLMYRRHAGQVTANKSWRAEHATDGDTTRLHEDLCRKLLGSHTGAYAALHGRGDLDVAVQLIDDVWRAAASFGPADRVGVRTNALAVKRLTKALYRT